MNWRKVTLPGGRPGWENEGQCPTLHAGLFLTSSARSTPIGHSFPPSRPPPGLWATAAHPPLRWLTAETKWAPESQPAMKKSALRLPKLKTRDELLRTAPELGRLLAADGEAAAPPPGTAGAAPLRARSPTGRRAGSPRRIVRKFSDDELTEEERVVGPQGAGLGHQAGEPGGRRRPSSPPPLPHIPSAPAEPFVPTHPFAPPPSRPALPQRAELEKVKAERAALLDSLAKLRADVGKSGGELQHEDIRLLRRELAAKQEKLNELRRATHELSDTWVLLGCRHSGATGCLAPPVDGCPVPPDAATNWLSGAPAPWRRHQSAVQCPATWHCHQLPHLVSCLPCSTIPAGWSSWRQPAGTARRSCRRRWRTCR